MVDISECLKAQNVDSDIIDEWNSPWNIAVDFQMDMSFDCEDIESVNLSMKE